MREKGRMKAYAIEFYYDEEEEEIVKTIINKGACYCGKLKVPFWNIFGESLLIQNCIVYQHTEEIDFNLDCEKIDE